LPFATFEEYELVKDMMQFIDFREPGPPDVLFVNERPIPIPGQNEILVKVMAAGVNRPDLSQRAGNYPPPIGASPFLGLEIAGVVHKLGADVSKWQLGDPVCALTNGGGYAEFCLVPEGQCLPLPKGWDFPEAASIPEAYFTVWGNMFMRTRLNRGENVLIHAGASGIGSCAIQLAKAFGAFVCTTVSSSNKAAFCKDLHADQVINYQEEDFVTLLKDKKMDVVFDIVGGDYFEKNLSLLKEEGRLIQVASMKSSRVALDLNDLLFKRLTIVGSTLRAQSAAAKARIAEELLEHVWPLFEKKVLKPVVTAVFPLSKAAEAHKCLESREHYGKIVLLTAPS
jgi:NADPH:quinone reductase